MWAVVSIANLFSHRLRIAGAEGWDRKRRCTEGRRWIRFGWRRREWTERQTERTTNNHQSETTRDSKSSVRRHAETDEAHAREARARNCTVHESDPSLVPEQTIQGTPPEQQRPKWLAKSRQVSYTQERHWKPRHPRRNGWSFAWSELWFPLARFVRSFGKRIKFYLACLHYQ